MFVACLWIPLLPVACEVARLPHLEGEPFALADCAEGVAEWGPWKRLLWTWRLTGVHPFAFLREKLAIRGVLTVAEARDSADGTAVPVAGLNLRPHRPPTRSGAVVLLPELEDETSHPLALVCLGDEVLDRCTAPLLLSPAVLVDGVVERQQGSLSVRVHFVRPLLLRSW